MHNLKLIRENLSSFKNKISKRNTKIDFDELIQLDKKYREIIGSKEKLEQQKKIISKLQDKKQFEKSKNISKEIDILIIEEKCNFQTDTTFCIFILRVFRVLPKLNLFLMCSPYKLDI